MSQVERLLGSLNRREWLIGSAFFGAIHLTGTLAVCAAGVAIGLSDHGVGIVEPVLNALWHVLDAPITLYLFAVDHSGAIPNLFEWCLLLSNSLLWGGFLILCWQCRRLGTKKAKFESANAQCHVPSLGVNSGQALAIESH